MPIADVLMRALTDRRINSVAAIKILGVWGFHADEIGGIHPDEDGQQVTDPHVIAKKLGISRAGAFAAFGVLSELGYIEWDRAVRGAERTAGITGRVRIIVSAS